MYAHWPLVRDQQKWIICAPGKCRTAQIRRQEQKTPLSIWQPNTWIQAEEGKKHNTVHHGQSTGTMWVQVEEWQYPHWGVKILCYSGLDTVWTRQVQIFNLLGHWSPTLSWHVSLQPSVSSLQEQINEETDDYSHKVVKAFQVRKQTPEMICLKRGGDSEHYQL